MRKPQSRLVPAALAQRIRTDPLTYPAGAKRRGMAGGIAARRQSPALHTGLMFIDEGRRTDQRLEPVLVRPPVQLRQDLPGTDVPLPTDVGQARAGLLPLVREIGRVELVGAELPIVHAQSPGHGAARQIQPPVVTDLAQIEIGGLVGKMPVRALGLHAKRMAAARAPSAQKQAGLSQRMLAGADFHAERRRIEATRDDVHQAAGGESTMVHATGATHDFYALDLAQRHGQIELVVIGLGIA